MDVFNGEKNQGIKMHNFPALNGNKNANETLWVLMMHTHALFSPVFFFFFICKADERQVSHADDASACFFDASGRSESS